MMWILLHLVKMQCGINRSASDVMAVHEVYTLNLRLLSSLMAQAMGERTRARLRLRVGDPLFDRNQKTYRGCL
jgi:hypothetical protein